MSFEMLFAQLLIENARTAPKSHKLLVSELDVSRAYINELPTKSCSHIVQNQLTLSIFIDIYFINIKYDSSFLILRNASYY